MSEEKMELAEVIVAELEAVADPERAEGERKYFKYTINNLGVTLPGIQKLERELCKDLAKTWSVDQAMQLAEVLLRKRVFEVTLLALTFLARFAERMGESEFARCEQWLADDLCDNWAATDHLCPHVVGSILQNHPHLATRLLEWADSENRWLRRGSAVTLVLPLRKGEFVDLAYEIAPKLFRDKNDDLVQKGNGWMLREAGLTDADRLEEFLLRHGPDIPRTTLRYAIEKFAKDRRARILAETK